MTYERFYVASQYCSDYMETDTGLVFCTHPDNECQTEGNCTQTDCPALKEIKEFSETLYKLNEPP